MSADDQLQALIEVRESHDAYQAYVDSVPEEAFGGKVLSYERLSPLTERAIAAMRHVEAHTHGKEH